MGDRFLAGLQSHASAIGGGVSIKDRGVQCVHLYQMSLQESTMSQSETVTIRLSAEVKGKLEALAASTNRSKSWLAAQAIASYIEEQSWQIQQIEAAVTLADSNSAAWVENADVNAWLDSWGTENELPTP
jgi:RHH-type transcriptional regulator, rel operon repressor / antitoxin RelB